MILPCDFIPKQSYIILYLLLLYINPSLPQDKKRYQQEQSKMVKQVRASLTCFVLFFLVIATSMISIVHSTNTVTVTREDQARKPRKRWQKKTWMNHGSHRGPRKHLVNPTTENVFQLAREFPV